MDSQAATTPTWPICSYWTRKGVHQGRFRETVLFCWSTIDSVFNRRYGALVDAALLDEWGEARDFFKGLDFKLRNKMMPGMHLVANRSLFREPGDFWQRLSASYSKRNAIIHRGENASEDEATQAVAVARQIVRIMRGVVAGRQKGHQIHSGSWRVIFRYCGSRHFVTSARSRRPKPKA